MTVTYYNQFYPTIDQPSAITYVIGSTGNSITWHPSSLVPDHYTVSVNGSSPMSYSWNGSAITYSVDGLSMGTYSVNCTVYDTNNLSATSVVTVTVLPLAPKIDQPSPVTYVAGATGNNITWNPSSQIPESYTISVNGSSPTSYSWNGQAITYSVDGWSPGTYAVNCTVYDALGRSASSTVTVTVQPSPSDAGTPIILLLGISGAAALAVVVVFLVVVRKMKSR
jgi:hypothetical protein